MPLPPLTPESQAYSLAISDLLARLLKYGLAAWGATSIDDAGAAALAQRMAPAVTAAQVQVANLTSVFLARQTGTAPVRADEDLITRSRGVDPEAVYQRPVIATRSELKQSVLNDEPVDLDAAREVGAHRLESLVTTDLQLAKVHQARTSLIASERKYYRRVPRPEGACALCLIASTQRYKIHALMPIHPGCVPGDSAVSIPAGVGCGPAAFAWGELEAVSRRLFKGELVEFVTAGGDQVRVTPNHPVLTDKGWIPADLLRVGDAVFSSGHRERIAHGGPQVDQRPALAKDVFDAARVAFPLVRMPLAAEDFHADGAQGEVDIVYTNGCFPTERNAELIEVVRESSFVNTHFGRLAFDSGRSFSSLSLSGLPAFGGGVRGSSLSGDLFGGHSGHPGPVGTGPITRFDAPAEKFSFENAAVYASQGLHLKSRLAGLVESDSIVELRRVSFSDHVFNLHTREGWYASNNGIVSNCHCGIEVLPDGMNLDDNVIDVDLLNATHARVKEFAGIADRGGRAPDYRKLLITRQHGELGSVLAYRDYKFTGSGDIKAQLQHSAVDLDVT